MTTGMSAPWAIPHGTQALFIALVTLDSELVPVSEMTYCVERDVKLYTVPYRPPNPS